MWAATATSTSTRCAWQAGRMLDPPLPFSQHTTTPNTPHSNTPALCCCLLPAAPPQTAAADEVVPAGTIVPGSVPVTGTYSRTEAEYQAAMGKAGGVTEATRTGAATGITGTGDVPAAAATEEGEVGGERPVAMGVAEVRAPCGGVGGRGA